MKTKEVPLKKDFIGRHDEIKKIHQISNGILIVYGRQRIGKTELPEQSFRKRHLLNFEGLENKRQSKQMTHVIHELAR